MSCSSCKFNKEGWITPYNSRKPKEAKIPQSKNGGKYLFCSNHKSVFYRLDTLELCGCEFFSQA